MRRDELEVGDRVWVYLGNEGGRGYATITRFLRPGVARVRFEEGYRHIFHWDARDVPLRSIIRKAD